MKNSVSIHKAAKLLAAPNLNRVANLVRQNKRITRRQISKITKLEISAVVRLVQRLLKSGLVREGRPEDSSRGRRAKFLELNPDFGLAIGIDIRPSYTMGVMVDIAGNKVGEARREIAGEYTPSSLVEEVVAIIDNMRDQKLVQDDRVLGIGVGAAGAVDSESGIALSASDFAQWRDVPVKPLLEERYGIPTLIEHSVKARALGEKVFGLGQGVDDLIFVSVDYGLGAGIISGGKLFRGVDGNAGAIAHMMVLEEKGRFCPVCGNYGCLESVASISAITERVRESLSDRSYSLIPELVDGNYENITIDIVTEAAKRGDTLAYNALEEAGRYLGIAIANMIYLFNPRLVVVGGSIAVAGDFILAPIKRVVRSRVLQFWHSNIDIVMSKLGEGVGALGATVPITDSFFSGRAVGVQGG